MPRKYVRKPGVEPRNIKWTEENLILAFRELDKKRIGLNEASRIFNIPNRTLKRRYKQKNVQQTTKGKCPVLGFDNESKLVSHILKLKEAGFVPGGKEICKLAYEYAEKMKLKHTFSEVTKTAGNGWLESFLERNPEIVLKPVEGLSIERVKSLNSAEVAHFFELLTTILTDNDLLDKPDKIFCMDEICVQINNMPRKVLTETGAKAAKLNTPYNKIESITVVACCSASGHFLPPVLIMKGIYKKAEFEVGLPAGSSVMMQKKSVNISTENFYDWLTEYFILLKPPGKVLLILDGHSSHLTAVNMLETARDNDVLLLCLPSHTVPALQPLEKSVFEPFKRYYEAEANYYVLNNPENKLNKYNSRELITKAWIKAATPDNAMSGFCGSGIYPVNPNALSDPELAISDFVSRKVAQKSEEQSNPLNEETPGVSEESVLREPSQDPQQDLRYNSGQLLTNARIQAAPPDNAISGFCGKEINRVNSNARPDAELAQESQEESNPLIEEAPGIPETPALIEFSVNSEQSIRYNSGHLITNCGVCGSRLSTAIPNDVLNAAIASTQIELNPQNDETPGVSGEPALEEPTENPKHGLRYNSGPQITNASIQAAPPNNTINGFCGCGIYTANPNALSNSEFATSHIVLGELAQESKEESDPQIDDAPGVTGEPALEKPSQNSEQGLLYNSGQLISNAWIQVATPDNPISGFCANGIYTANPNALSDAQFATSHIVSGALAQESKEKIDLQNDEEPGVSRKTALEEPSQNSEHGLLYNSGQLITNAWIQEAPPDNAISGFCGSGIYLFKPNALPDAEVATSDVVMGELEQESQEQSNPLNYERSIVTEAPALGELSQDPRQSLRYNTGQLINTAWIQVATPDNAISGFCGSGIHPVNSNAEFAASDIVSGELVQESKEQSNPLNEEALGVSAEPVLEEPSRNPEQGLLYNSGQLTTNAWIQVAAPDNTISGFCANGIYTANPNALSDAQFATTDIVSGELAQESQEETNPLNEETPGVFGEPALEEPSQNPEQGLQYNAGQLIFDAWTQTASPDSGTTDFCDSEVYLANSNALSDAELAIASGELAQECEEESDSLNDEGSIVSEEPVLGAPSNDPEQGLRYNSGQLINNAWIQVAAPDNAISGFCSNRIYSANPNALLNDKAPSVPEQPALRQLSQNLEQGLRYNSGKLITNVWTQTTSPDSEISDICGHEINLVNTNALPDAEFATSDVASEELAQESQEESDPLNDEAPGVSHKPELGEPPQNPEQSLLYNSEQLITNAWIQAAPPSNAISGFCGSVIYLANPNSLSDAEFSATDIVSGELLQESQGESDTQNDETPGVSGEPVLMEVSQDPEQSLRYNSGQLTTKAWIQVATPDNPISGFCADGIYTANPNVLSEAKFATSDTVSGELAQESEEESNPLNEEALGVSRKPVLVEPSQNPEQGVLYNSGHLITNAWIQVAAPDNTISGFCGNGIYTANPNALSDAQFATSDIVSSELAQESQEETNPLNEETPGVFGEPALGEPSQNPEQGLRYNAGQLINEAWTQTASPDSEINDFCGSEVYLANSNALSDTELATSDIASGELAQECEEESDSLNDEGSIVSEEPVLGAPSNDPEQGLRYNSGQLITDAWTQTAPLDDEISDFCGNEIYLVNPSDLSDVELATSDIASGELAQESQEESDPLNDEGSTVSEEPVLVELSQDPQQSLRYNSGQLVSAIYLVDPNALSDAEFTSSDIASGELAHESEELSQNPEQSFSLNSLDQMPVIFAEPALHEREEFVSVQSHPNNVISGFYGSRIDPINPSALSDSEFLTLDVASRELAQESQEECDPLSDEAPGVSEEPEIREISHNPEQSLQYNSGQVIRGIYLVNPNATSDAEFATSGIASEELALESELPSQDPEQSFASNGWQMPVIFAEPTSCEREDIKSVQSHALPPWNKVPPWRCKASSDADKITHETILNEAEQNSVIPENLYLPVVAMHVPADSQQSPYYYINT